MPFPTTMLCSTAKRDSSQIFKNCKCDPAKKTQKVSSRIKYKTVKVCNL